MESGRRCAAGPPLAFDIETEPGSLLAAAAAEAPGLFDDVRWIWIDEGKFGT